MKEVFTTYNNIVSPLGFDTKSNIENIANGISGVKKHENLDLLQSPFYASIIETNTLNSAFSEIGTITNYTRLEKMMLLSLQDVIKQSKVSLNKRTALIISTTKGNVDVLDDNNNFSKQRAYLSELGNQIQSFFGFENEAIIVSNACVSGILAVAVAKRLIQNDVYDNALIVSGDVLSEFILSGFNSFQAISNSPCKPFSNDRTGINLGEAAATILVTSNKNLVSNDAAKILGDGSCNDANHISGPSRTGEGLVKSIQSAFDEAKIDSKAIDYISAHGTATEYNDEMEAVAIDRLSLNKTPINSLKGYYGHTLGASGLVEAIVGLQSIHNNTLYTSLGFNELGVSKNINVIEHVQQQNLNVFLKTASGFGGCNTAVIFKKIK